VHPGKKSVEGAHDALTGVDCHAAAEPCFKILELAILDRAHLAVLKALELEEMIVDIAPVGPPVSGAAPTSLTARSHLSAWISNLCSLKPFKVQSAGLKSPWSIAKFILNELLKGPLVVEGLAVIQTPGKTKMSPIKVKPDFNVRVPAFPIKKRKTR
jgi:hypothetical protein